MCGNVNRNAFILCVVLLNIVNVGIAADAAAEGYCWRDFNGAIPTDALQGGIDVNRKPIYIGQVLYDVYLVPAKIYSDGRMYFEYGGLEHNTSKNMKILCTQYPERFEWLQTTNNDLKLLTKRNLMIGGYDKPGTTTYIGRVRVGGEVAVGKLLADIAEVYAGLHITRGGRGERHTSYAVLVFNPPPVIHVGSGKEPHCKQVVINFF